MGTAGFFEKYKVSLNELLIAPLVFREALPVLGGLRWVDMEVMRDLARFGGYKDGAIRTAISRLLSAGFVEAVSEAEGKGYRLGSFGRSVSKAFQERFSRPDGYVLAIYSFATNDAQGRQVVRNALKAHGFFKLAQNVYISGKMDTTALEAGIQEQGFGSHLFFFRCEDDCDEERDRRLQEVFDVEGRMATLQVFEKDLRNWLEAPDLSGDAFVRRYLAAGPIHYRITFEEEPPIPARCLPPKYPLHRLLPYGELSQERAQMVLEYFQNISTTHR